MTISASAHPPRGTDSFLSRVLDNEALKKGLSAAAAGILIAVITVRISRGRERQDRAHLNAGIAGM